MGEIISVSINKGGTGKTSIVTNLAGAIERKLGKKVLIIDTDGQGNSAIAFGYKQPSDFKKTIYDVLLGKEKAEDVIIKITDNISLLPANKEMNFIELDILPNLKEYGNPFNLLRDAIEGIVDDYDYILIDTPPSMGLIAGNVLATVDSVIIPFVPETFGVNGLINLIEGIKDFKEEANPDLNTLGVVGMMIDTRTTLHKELLEQAKEYCKLHDIRVFDTTIRKSIRFANATAYTDKPATLVDSNNEVVKLYYDLLDEITKGDDL